MCIWTNLDQKGLGKNAVILIISPKHKSNAAVHLYSQVVKSSFTFKTAPGKTSNDSLNNVFCEEKCCHSSRTIDICVHF